MSSVTRRLVFTSVAWVGISEMHHASDPADSMYKLASRLTDRVVDQAEGAPLDIALKLARLCHTHCVHNVVHLQRRHFCFGLLKIQPYALVPMDDDLAGQ